MEATEAERKTEQIEALVAYMEAIEAIEAARATIEAERTTIEAARKKAVPSVALGAREAREAALEALEAWKATVGDEPVRYFVEQHERVQRTVSDELLSDRLLKAALGVETFPWEAERE